MVRNVIIKTPTKEDWIKVMREAIRDGCEKWGEDGKEWNEYKEESCIHIMKWGAIYYGTYKGVYRGSTYSNCEYITTQEYLDKFEWETSTGDVIGDVLIEAISDLTSSGEQISQKKTIMNKITSSIKRLFNAKLQKQYKAGLIDNCGNLTNEGEIELKNIIRDEFEDKLTAIAEDIIKEAKE